MSMVKLILVPQVEVDVYYRGFASETDPPSDAGVEITEVVITGSCPPGEDLDDYCILSKLTEEAVNALEIEAYNDWREDDGLDF